MSRLTTGTSTPSCSWIRAARRCASGTPRLWTPTITRSSVPPLRSTISCAMRTNARRSSSAPRIWRALIETTTPSVYPDRWHRNTALRIGSWRGSVGDVDTRPEPWRWRDAGAPHLRRLPPGGRGRGPQEGGSSELRRGIDERDPGLLPIRAETDVEDSKLVPLLGGHSPETQ